MNFTLKRTCEGKFRLTHVYFTQNNCLQLTVLSGPHSLLGLQLVLQAKQ